MIPTTMSKEKPVAPIPEEFASHEEAAEFWDTNDTTDYPDAFRTVEVVATKRPKLHGGHEEGIVL